MSNNSGKAECWHIAGRRAFLANGSALLSAICLGGCILNTEEYSYNLKVVVTLEGKRGQIQKESVIRIDAWRRNYGFHEARSWRYSCFGEAIVFTIGGNQSLAFILANKSSRAPAMWLLGAIQRDDSERVSNDAYSDGFPFRYDREKIRSLNPEQYPSILYFQNNLDPGSAKIVSPDEIASYSDDNWKIVSVTVQPTKRTVTEGVRAIYPWIPEHRYSISGRPESIKMLIQIGIRRHQ